jgi:hypothetical protein
MKRSYVLIKNHITTNEFDHLCMNNDDISKSNISDNNNNN